MELGCWISLCKSCLVTDTVLLEPDILAIDFEIVEHLVINNIAGRVLLLFNNHCLNIVLSNNVIKFIS